MGKVADGLQNMANLIQQQTGATFKFRPCECDHCQMLHQGVTMGLVAPEFVELGQSWRVKPNVSKGRCPRTSIGAFLGPYLCPDWPYQILKQVAFVDDDCFLTMDFKATCINELISFINGQLKKPRPTVRLMYDCLKATEVDVQAFASSFDTKRLIG